MHLVICRCRERVTLYGMTGLRTLYVRKGALPCLQLATAVATAGLLSSCSQVSVQMRFTSQRHNAGVELSW